ncbi:MAG TPA: VWA domain-containing protein, partial [Thermomicrobiales bacterium]|nr:VWA domain-containing protein [Thermomicrobiales bacterium]
NPRQYGAGTDPNDASDDQSSPTPLELNQTIPGQAQIGKDVDWYSIRAPKGKNTLTFSLTGDPTVDVIVRVFDKDGNEAPVTRQVIGDTRRVAYTATVKPGATYSVKVEQPAHSIVFTFDTSASISSYVPMILRSVRAFAGGVVKGQEFINVIPFDEDPLLDTFSDNAYVVYGAVNSYADFSSSSSAETGLLDSSKQLQAQEGTTAILLETDAETSSFTKSEEMWDLLNSVQPRVFAVHVGGSSTPQIDKNLMQDWTSYGGMYQYVTTQIELDRAFDRAATILRRPTEYTISVSATQVEEQTPTPVPTAEPLQPGTLAIAAPPASSDANAPAAQISDQVTVEIIFDTSGSMLGGMLDGQRRIDVARSVLTDLVTNQLPAGMPVTLRVFGNVPDSCDTNLLVPLGPLDPAAMSQTIQSIEPVNLVRTPIGKSLEMVASDLAGVTGPKVVILVTDGEETCDGDPAKAIRDLRAQGVDVQVNIVGFALDDDALRAQFADWRNWVGAPISMRPTRPNSPMRWPKSRRRHSGCW